MWHSTSLIIKHSLHFQLHKYYLAAISRYFSVLYMDVLSFLHNVVESFYIISILLPAISILLYCKGYISWNAFFRLLWLDKFLTILHDSTDYMHFLTHQEDLAEGRHIFRLLLHFTYILLIVSLTLLWNHLLVHLTSPLVCECPKGKDHTFSFPYPPHHSIPPQ